MIIGQKLRGLIGSYGDRPYHDRAEVEIEISESEPNNGNQARARRPAGKGEENAEN